MRRSASEYGQWRKALNHRKGFMETLKTELPGAYDHIVNFYTLLEEFVSQEKDYADYHKGYGVYEILEEIAGELEDLSLFVKVKNLKGHGRGEQVEARFRKAWLDAMFIAHNQWRNGIWSADGYRVARNWLSRWPRVNDWAQIVLISNGVRNIHP
tara:strand:- start:262 stop:726 length:465 start_codon:yes stop_codon:yes gene_type:complete